MNVVQIKNWLLLNICQIGDYCFKVVIFQYLFGSLTILSHLDGLRVSRQRYLSSVCKYYLNFPACIPTTTV